MSLLVCNLPGISSGADTLPLNNKTLIFLSEVNKRAHWFYIYLEPWWIPMRQIIIKLHSKWKNKLQIHLLWEGDYISFSEWFRYNVSNKKSVRQRNIIHFSCTVWRSKNFIKYSQNNLNFWKPFFYSWQETSLSHRYFGC